jgi:hypothetical protein
VAARRITAVGSAGRRSMRLTVPPGRDLRGFADATVTGARKRPRSLDRVLAATLITSP